jgi:hypothetical protein
LMLNVVVHPADVQDRDGGLLVLQAVPLCRAHLRRWGLSGRAHGRCGPGTRAVAD